MNDHYSQKPRRNAEFIKPPNMLKTKVGTGGLSEEILSRAQDLLENNTGNMMCWSLSFMRARNGWSRML